MTDENKIDQEEYNRQFTEVLKRFAGLIADRPDMIDSLRESLKLSAQMMMSNKPEAVTEFRDLAGEIDQFMHACKTGEIDPVKFSGKDKEENMDD